MTDSARSPEERLAASWIANAEAWTRAVRQGQIPSRRRGTDRAILEAVAAALAERSGRRVLDVGCGEGWLVGTLAAQGLDAVGVDGSAPLIDAARALPGTYHCLSYEAIATAPEQLGAPYDVILCNFALLGQDLSPLLQALHTRLRPGGTLLIQTLHPCNLPATQRYADGWQMETFDAFEQPFPEAMPWYFRTLGSWVDLIVGTGYTLARLIEPQPPDAARPLSLLLVCRAR